MDEILNKLEQSAKERAGLDVMPGQPEKKEEEWSTPEYNYQDYDRNVESVYVIGLNDLVVVLECINENLIQIGKKLDN
jgi:hypothetical protein